MKNLATLVFCFAISLGSAVASAQEITQPIHPPAGLDEGTKIRISPAEYAALEPWLDRTVVKLREMLDSAPTESIPEEREFLATRTTQILQDSGSLQSELLVRDTLARALKICELIEKESDITQPGGMDQEVYLLRHYAEFAINYSNFDEAVLKANKDALPPYAQFGLDQVKQLMQADQSILDASAQFRIALFAMGLLEWDLFRSKDQGYGAAILKIHHTIDQPGFDQVTNDTEALAKLRRIKQVYASVLRSIQDEAATNTNGSDASTNSGLAATGIRAIPYGNLDNAADPLSIAVDPNAKYVALRQVNSQVRIFDLILQKPISYYALGQVEDRGYHSQTMTRFSDDGQSLWMGLNPVSAGFFVDQVPFNISHSNTYALKDNGYDRMVFIDVETNASLDRVVASPNNGGVSVYDGKLKHVVDLGNHAGSYQAVAIDDTGRFVAGGTGHSLVIWDLDDGRYYVIDAVNGITFLQFLPWGTKLAAMDRRGKLRLYDAANRKLLFQSSEDFSQDSYFAFCPKGSEFLVLEPHDASHITVFNADGSQVSTRSIPARVTAAAFTPDCGSLVAGSSTTLYLLPTFAY